jgi:peroxiredoxin
LTFLAGYAAEVAERSRDIENHSLLYRGRRILLPVLESTADLPFALEECVGSRNALLILHAGSWCPQSRALLARIETMRVDFEAANTLPIAISPELPHRALATKNQLHLGYPLAIDHACRFVRSTGMMFKLPVPVRRQLRAGGVRLKTWNGEGSYDLPLPALLMLDQSRRLRWHQVAATPERLALEDALAAAQNVQFVPNVNPKNQAIGKAGRLQPVA